MYIDCRVRLCHTAPWAYITHTFYSIRSTRDQPKERKLTESRQACSLFALVGAYLAPPLALVRDEITFGSNWYANRHREPHQFLDANNNLGNSPQQFQLSPLANPSSPIVTVHDIRNLWCNAMGDRDRVISS
jgi:hypothetical protein